MGMGQTKMTRRKTKSKGRCQGWHQRSLTRPHVHHRCHCWSLITMSLVMRDVHGG